MYLISDQTRALFEEKKKNKQIKILPNGRSLLTISLKHCVDLLLKKRSNTIMMLLLM
jgi:hypothetical protein